MKMNVWHLVAVPIAWAAIAAAPPASMSDNAVADRHAIAQSLRGIEQVLQSTESKANKRVECKAGADGDRSSDLCAQWKAADAAAEATDWAERSFYLGLLGAGLAALTMAAAIAAAKFARDAALHTKRSADEAERAATAAAEGIKVSISAISQSSEQFEATNRPWIAIENVAVKYGTDPGSDSPNNVVCVVAYELVNYGNMPALAVNSYTSLDEWDFIVGPPPLDVDRLLITAPFAGSVVFPSERRLKGRLDGTAGALGIGSSADRASISLGLRIQTTYRGSDDAPYVTARDVMICTPGSTETRMGSIMFANLSREFVQASVIEVRGGNVII